VTEHETTFQNQPVDISEEFGKQENHFLSDRGLRSLIGAPRPER
jgi:hypothetical protein